MQRSFNNLIILIASFAQSCSINNNISLKTQNTQLSLQSQDFNKVVFAQL